MHHSPRVTLAAGPVAYLLSAGAGVEVVGMRCWDLPRAMLADRIRPVSAPVRPSGQIELPGERPGGGQERGRRWEILNTLRGLSAGTRNGHSLPLRIVCRGCPGSATPASSRHARWPRLSAGAHRPDEVPWVWTGRGHRYVDHRLLRPNDPWRITPRCGHHAAVTVGVGVSVPGIKPLGSPARTMSTVTLLLRSPAARPCANTAWNGVQPRCGATSDMTAIVGSRRR
jgi:hypothetical protein